MNRNRRPRNPRSRACLHAAIGSSLLTLLILLAALLGHQSSASEVPDTPERTPPLMGVRPTTTTDTRTAGDGQLGAAGGAMPNGADLDDGEPGIANLDRDLHDALRAAQSMARPMGVRLTIDSGWRSRAYQQVLLDQAVRKYGSRGEALRWVAPPDASAHVTGDAVDIGPPSAAEWLARHGAQFGLCRVYRNEPWHFELRSDALERGCPDLYEDPRDDPRLSARNTR